MSRFHNIYPYLHVAGIEKRLVALYGTNEFDLRSLKITNEQP